MENMIQEALAQYEFINPKLDFIRHNENITYKVTDEVATYVLRVHKPVEGFSLGILQQDSDIFKYIESEMQLIEYAEKHMKTPMQKPKLNKSGQLVSVLADGTYATVLKWVQGDTLNNVSMTDEIGEAIGTMVAELHQCFGKLTIDDEHDIKRYRYDQKMLGLIEDELSEIVNKGQINQEKVDIIADTVCVIKAVMDELDVKKSMSGIIHADMSPTNLLFSDGHIVPIDFSLSGFGCHYMDIGLIISNYKENHIKKGIISGYEKITKEAVPLPYVETFFALGVILFIACQHDKIHALDWFDAALERWCKTIFEPLIKGDSFIYEV